MQERISCTYLSEECLHGGPVLQTWQPVQASHEGLTQVPWARPISAAHHVHPISIGGGRLPDQMAVHGAPGGVGAFLAAGPERPLPRPSPWEPESSNACLARPRPEEAREPRGVEGEQCWRKVRDTSGTVGMVYFRWIRP